jgi:hypothetical protein
MSSLLIKLMIVWAAGIVTLQTLAAQEADSAPIRAILGMSLVLALLWIVGGGLISWRSRAAIRARVLPVRLGWRLKFVLFCIGLALLEEAVTVSMTNLAPLFGVAVGEAYITASADYLDVVLFHSVIVFVPMFVVWAWLLGRRAFSPNAVFLLFGVTGTLGEMISFGAQPVTLGFWVCIYGLMVYLPAYSLPSAAERGAIQPHLLDYPLALVLPFLLAIPVAIVVGSIHPISIHFPPIAP